MQSGGVGERNTTSFTGNSGPVGRTAPLGQRLGTYWLRRLLQQFRVEDRDLQILARTYSTDKHEAIEALLVSTVKSAKLSAR